MKLLSLALIASLAGCSRPSAAPESQVLSFEAFAAQPRDFHDANCDDSCANYRQELAYIVYVGKAIYCYWDEKKADTGYDYDALATKLEGRIVTGTTPTEYYLIARQWAGAFHDGHVNFMPPADLSPYEIYTAPVRLELLAPGTKTETLVIASVAQTTPGGSPISLVSGQKVIAVNGVPAADAVSNMVPYMSGSTVRMRRLAAARRLTDAFGAAAGAVPLSLTVEPLKTDGPNVTLELPRTVEIDLPDTPAPAGDPTGADLVKAAVLPGGVGYLRIDGFSGTKDKELLTAAMQRLKDTKGLVLDLRKNGGGDQSGNVVLARLAAQELTRYRTSERMADFTLSARPEDYFQPWTAGNPYSDWQDLKVQPAPAAEQFGAGKKVVALTSPNCFSACDTFAAGLRANGLAVFLGDGTGGGTGTPLVFNLPVSLAQFRYSTIKGHTAKDEVIEGHGTEPDVSLPATTDDRAASKDGQLAAAIQIIVGAAAPAQAAAAVAVQSFGPTWTQSMEVSPTVADERALARFAPVDELAR